MIDLPAVTASLISHDCSSDRIAQLDVHSLDIYKAIEEIGIDKVGIKRKLFRMLPKVVRLISPLCLVLPIPTPI
jgi:hypothetical protein